MSKEITSWLQLAVRRNFIILCVIVALLFIMGTLHVQPSFATSADSRSCQDVRTADPAAGDGSYSILVNSTFVDIYCADMSTSPKEYITLLNTGSPYNFSRYAGGGFRPSISGDVITSYEKVRVHITTLQIDTTDRRFSSSSGAVSSADPWMNYGSAGDCKYNYSGNGTGNVDLRGTPFHVSPHQFAIQGWKPNGYTSYSNDNQTVDLAGGGACGGNDNGNMLQLYLDASLSVILTDPNGLDVNFNTSADVVIENVNHEYAKLVHTPRNSTMFEWNSLHNDIYVSSNIPTGTYTVWINTQGYKTIKLDGIQISPGQLLEVPVTLSLNSAVVPSPHVIYPLNETTIAQNEPLISGTADPNDIINVLVDDLFVGTATANGSGSWLFTLVVPLADGIHSVKATAADAAGNTSLASNINTITIDTTSPAAPMINPLLGGTIISSNQPMISGTAEPYNLITLKIDGVYAGSVNSDNIGNWSFTPAVALAEALHQVQAMATDTVGNSSGYSNGITFTCGSSNGAITGLVLSDIALNETVTASTYVYHANVPYSTDTTTVSAVLSDPHASVSFISDGHEIANPVSLLVGLNTMTVQVTAQNGAVTDYTLLVDRAMNTNANLANLNLFVGNQEVVLPEAFDANQLLYTVTVSDSVYNLNLSTHAVDLVNAKLTVNNVTYEPGSLTTQVALNTAGTTLITITVTAQNTSIQKTYTIQVVKTSNLVVMNAKTDLTGNHIFLQFIDYLSHSDLSGSPFIVKINGIVQEVQQANYSTLDSNTVVLTLAGKPVQIGDNVTVDMHQAAVWTVDGITNLNMTGISVENTPQRQLKTELQGFSSGTGKIHISEVMAWMKLKPHDLDGDGIFTHNDILLLLQQIDPVN